MYCIICIGKYLDHMQYGHVTGMSENSMPLTTQFPDCYSFKTRNQFQYNRFSGKFGRSFSFWNIGQVFFMPNQCSLGYFISMIASPKWCAWGACYSSTIPGCPFSRQWVEGLLGDVGAKYGCPAFCMKQTNVTSSFMEIHDFQLEMHQLRLFFIPISSAHPCGGDVSVLLC